MPSPFPGMNPYLERDSACRDVHENLLAAAQHALNRQILPNYFAKLDEHVFIEDVEEGSRRVVAIADIAVADLQPREGEEGSVQTLAPPALVQQTEIELERFSFLEVRDRDRQELVTVLELLSPANKRRGKIRQQYLAKRELVLGSDAHFIEIDLLRGGPRMPWRDMPACDYYALVSRVEGRPSAGIWPIGIRDHLPTIPVPLRHGDRDAHLDLQALLHQAYDDAGYAVYIYSHPPDPPLPPEHAQWAKELAGASP